MKKNNQYDQNTFNLISLSKILIKSTRLIIIATISFALIGYLYSSKVPPVYSAESLIEIGVISQDSSNKHGELKLVESTDNLIQRLIIEYDYKNIEKKYSYSFTPIQKNLIKIIVKSKHKDEVQNTLNSINSFIIDRHKLIVDKKYIHQENLIKTALKNNENLIHLILNSQLLEMDIRIKEISAELEVTNKMIENTSERIAVANENRESDYQNSFEALNKLNFSLEMHKLAKAKFENQLNEIEQYRNSLKNSIKKQDYQNLVFGSFINFSQSFITLAEIITQRGVLISELEAFNEEKNVNSLSSKLLNLTEVSKSSSSLFVSVFLSSIIGFIFGSVLVLLFHFYRLSKK